jgi:ribosomal protein S8
MNQKITISDFSQHLFWDVDLSDFDFQKHKVHLIHKVLEYGYINDWNLVKEIYGLQTIKEVSLNLRSLDAVTLSYLAALFNIDKTEFRCYKHKQLFPNYWNS